LERREVFTALGATSFYGLPEPPGATRPVLVVIASSFMTIRSLNKLPELLADLCHVALAEVPLVGPGAGPRVQVQRLAEHLGFAVHDAFRGRRVVLAGFGDAALVVLRASAPEILRRVAVEPPLRSDKLWPLRARVREKVQTVRAPGMTSFLEAVYGASGDAPEPLDHRSALAWRPTPVDVVVGERPLMPERPLETAPSLVDEEERDWLRGLGNVKLRIAPGAGHAVEREAGGFLLGVLREAVGFAAGLRRAPADVVGGIAAAAPRTAKRVLYLGPQAAAFERAYRAYNPQALFAAGPDADGFDLLVAQDPAIDGSDLSRALAALAPGGVLLVATALGAAWKAAADLVAAAGLEHLPVDPINGPLGVAIVRGRKAPAAARAPVEIMPYAPVLMDIRTRLPAEALSRDPDLEVAYFTPPARPNPEAEPRVVVMQRPAEWTPERWRAAAAQAILSRQVLVLEFDDHPELIAEIITGKDMKAGGWERFRVAHAIQTTTEPLVEVFRSLNSEVMLAPNAVFDLPPFPTAPRSRRVFYGGVLRGEFAVAVARSLGPAIAAFPDAEFHVMGDRAFFDALPTARKQYTDYAPYARYLEMMAACSISLSPLETRRFIETKSDAKYLDAARSGVLTIASPIVYGRVIRSGENGLIAPGIEDWSLKLAEVLGDPAGAERMARAAWEDVRTRRMFAHQIPARRAWYRDLLARREDLDRAVLERSPGVAEIVARRRG
jgi:hypothetical protein